MVSAISKIFVSFAEYRIKMLPSKQPRIRNGKWKDDELLRTELEEYVKKRWSIRDILTVVLRKFPQYAWTVPTLKRRLGFFDIRYIDSNVTSEQLAQAVASELLNVGGDLGFRAMTAKVREKHDLKVKERDVLAALKDLDPQGVERRGDVGCKTKKKRKDAFVSSVS